MSADPNEDPLALRRVIEDFLQQRLEEKLRKLGDGDRSGLFHEYRRDVWLASAASRVRQLKLASHTLKAIHPDARGTNIYLRSPMADTQGLVGSDAIRDLEPDVVGNAAALDVFKFLKLRLNAESLIQRLLRSDPIVEQALSDDPEQAREWALAFTDIANTGSLPASHTLAKQMYFPVAGDAYHLLAPLFPTALVHVWHKHLQTIRWSEDAKAAREARRKRQPLGHGFSEYLGLASRSFGGSKPQNISQLNNDRRGESHLLPSLPPNWNSPPIQPPMHCRSIFERAFPRRPAVAELTQRLRWFLQEHRDPGDNNLQVRTERAALVDAIVDELLAYAAELRALPSGWSNRMECRLRDVQIAWLDPESITDEHFGDEPEQRDTWPELVAVAFGNWLASALQTRTTTFGDTEIRAFRHELSPHLKALQKELEAERESAAALEGSHVA